MWPLTKKNLSLMVSENGQLARLIGLAALLDGGVLIP